MNKRLLVSVIVCTYNGENRIRDCLEALIIQDYPKDRYEIIVVDDGSTDGTNEIVSEYPVKVIKHKKNLGICSARNTGLHNANGTIVVYTDDDCTPKRSWLENLVKFYRDDVVAVGGLTVPFSCNTITEKYMAETGYGNPAPLEFGKSKNPLYRFLVYLKDMFFPVTATSNPLIEVYTIYTSNASFRKNILEQIGGWDEDLKFGGDTEICLRIHKKLVGKKILFTNKAKIIHKHHTSFIKFLKDIFLRNGDRIKYYLKYKKIPPIFPFPIFIILITLISWVFNLFYGFFSLLFLPQILYIWWPIKFFKKLKLYYLLFPYIQFILELATTLGMFMGYIKQTLKQHYKNETKHK